MYINIYEQKRVASHSKITLCAHLGSNQGPNDYESFALTDWAISAFVVPAGFEPTYSESKSDVLPLDEGTFVPKVGLAPTCSFELDILASIYRVYHGNLASATWAYSPSWDYRWVDISGFLFVTLRILLLENVSSIRRRCWTLLPFTRIESPLVDIFYSYPLLNESWIKDYWVSLTHCHPYGIQTHDLFREREATSITCPTGD